MIKIGFFDGENLVRLDFPSIDSVKSHFKKMKEQFIEKNRVEDVNTDRSYKSYAAMLDELVQMKEKEIAKESIGNYNFITMNGQD